MATKSLWYIFSCFPSAKYTAILLPRSMTFQRHQRQQRSCCSLRFGDGNRGKKSESIYPPKFINIKEESATLEGWQRGNGNIKVEWKHQRRSSNIKEGAATSEEEWKHQRRRPSARLLLYMDRHPNQDHSPQRAVLSGIVAQGDVKWS